MENHASSLNKHLGYNERQDNLKIRLEANKRFSNFSLEDWMQRRLPFKKGDIILDIGCGNGNFFSVYAKKLLGKGVIVGIDKSQTLLREATKVKCNTPRILIEWDMNCRFPFMEAIFNYVISTFAVYYAAQPKEIIKDIFRVLKSSGQMFLIGPTHNNARELYVFNKHIFNIGKNPVITKRESRIEKEIYPIAKKIFSDIWLEKKPAKLSFPNKTEFIKYYLATLLFEESKQKTGFCPEREKLFSANIDSLVVSKEIIILRGRKSG